MRGILLFVTVDNRSAGLASDAAIGDTVLDVDNAAPFDESAGRLLLDGTVVTYLVADPDANTITLAAPLTTAVDADASVLLLTATGEPAEVWTALVDVDLDSVEPLEATIPTTLIDYFVLGDAQAGDLIEVRADDYEGYVVVSRPEQATQIDLTNADPTTIPDPVPVEAPAESPALTVTGDATGLVVIADAVAPSTLLDYSIDGVPVLTDSRSTVVKLIADGTGATLDPTGATTYTVSVVAHNVVGAAPSAAAAPTALDPGATPAHTVAQLNAALINGGRITIGNITIDATDGFNVSLASGGFISFPADGSDAVIDAVLRTTDLVVSGGLQINGVDNALGGALTLASGVVAPRVKPTLAHTYSSTPLGLATPYYGGGALNAAGTVLGMIEVDADGTTTRLATYDRATGARIAGSVNAPAGNRLMSVTHMGTNWWVLVRGAVDAGGNCHWAFRSYSDASLTSSGNISVLTGATGTPAFLANQDRVTITNDGTDLWLVDTGAPGSQVRFYQHDTSGARLSTTGSYVTNLTRVVGVYRGAADTGTTYWWLVGVNATGAGVLMVLDSTGATRQPTREFPLSPGSSGILAYDGTRFVSNSGNRLYSYSAAPAATTRYAGYTWYDNDSAGSTHETMLSPVASYLVPSRAWLQVTTAKPDDQGGTDDPNAARIYIGASPTTTKLQPDLATGQTVSTWETFATTTDPPTTEGFPGGGKVGLLQSVDTDGTGAALAQIGGNGQARLAKLIQSGTLTITPATVGVAANAVVTFPVPFDVAPRVQVTAKTTTPEQCDVSTGIATTTGVTVYLTRSTLMATVIEWDATTAT